MNLLRDEWLPVRLRSGERRRVRISALCRDLAGPTGVVAIDAPRPDFQGALFELCVGLLQLALAPADRDAWRSRVDTPPTEDELARALAPYAPAFELMGDGPLFCQDASLPLTDEPRGIQQILIDAPGESTAEKNKDIFVRAGRLSSLCGPCAAAAIYTLQANAPGGGKGHRTGLRGGGPWCSVLTADAQAGESAALFRSLWLNVLPADAFESGKSGDPRRSALADVFGWWSCAALAAGKGRDVSVEDVAPCHVYFTLPRRIRLNFTFTAVPTECDLCGQASTAICTSFVTRAYGLNYVGPWEHPLTPRYRNQKEGWLPVHPQPGGMSYRHWPQIAQTTADREAALVVRYHLAHAERRRGTPSRIWSFGYDMDNMKARCFYEAVMPTEAVPLDAAARREFEAQVEIMVGLAGDLNSSVRRCIVEAIEATGESDAGKTLGRSLAGAIWRMTEGAFFAHLGALRGRIEADEAPEPVLWSWFQVLRDAARSLFDTWASDDLVRVAPERLAKAWHDLQKATGGARKRHGIVDPTAQAATPQETKA